MKLTRNKYLTWKRLRVGKRRICSLAWRESWYAWTHGSRRMVFVSFVSYSLALAELSFCWFLLRLPPELWPPLLPISLMCSLFLLTISPPFLPALRASSLFHSWATPCLWAARPPSLAICLCLSGLMAAKPRLLLPLLRPLVVSLFDTCLSEDCWSICSRLSIPWFSDWPLWSDITLYI